MLVADPYETKKIVFILLLRYSEIGIQKKRHFNMMKILLPIIKIKSLTSCTCLFTKASAIRYIYQF